MHTLPVLAANTAGYDAAARRRWGVIAGVALSLLLHGWLIFGYRSALPPAPLPTLAPNQTMTVWIQAPPRIPEEVRKPDVAAPTVQSQPQPLRHPKPAPRKTERKPLQRDTTASQAAPAQAITLPAPSADQSADLRPAEPTPHLDMDAARRTARATASEPDPGHAPGTLAAQLDKHPLYSQSEQDKLARAMGGAKRPNCKDGIPGGLLAPLFLLLDKKDSGCKW